MDKEALGPNKNGRELISLLQNPNNLVPTIYFNQNLTDENDITKIRETFVVFPSELARVFPGSYIDPSTFLYELKVEGDISTIQARLLGRGIGTIDNPILPRGRLDEETNTNFSLTVLNGVTNDHALEMTRRAWMGFDKGINRALYQYHMLESIKPLLEQPGEINYGVRIFDDCIASADSILAYLYKLIQEGDNRLSTGVEVVAVTATAQAILLLNSFAKANNFNLSIKVGQLAFGLSEGKEKDGVREHANYLTYPRELLSLLDESLANELESYETQIGNEWITQVLWDMGAAEEGITVEEMEEIRQLALIKRIVGEGIFAEWNNIRTDPHGLHALHDQLEPPEITGNRLLHIYLGRGGFLPYLWDQMFNPNSQLVDIIIEIGSRRWTKELGYGEEIEKFKKSPNKSS